MTKSDTSDEIIRKSCPSWARLEGTSIQDWKILHPIGRGGMAEVYLLEHQRRGEKAALKLLLPEFSNDAEGNKIFLREIDFLEDIEHPRIPKMILHVTILDRIGLIMDYIPGQNLMTLVHQGAKIPPLAALMSACKIIASLHDENIAHNDIKLANFILSPQGILHCVDFGSARRLSLSSTFFRRLKGAGPLHGTLSYLSPELIQGKSPTKASDVWALGIVAHFLFTGSAPFKNDDPKQLAKLITTTKIPPLKSRVPTTDASLSGIIDRCLISDTSLRYSDAGELLSALRRYRDGTNTHRRKN